MRYSTSSEKQNQSSLSNRKSTVASIFNVLGSKQAEDLESGQDFHDFRSLVYRKTIENLTMILIQIDPVQGHVWNTEIVFEILT